MPDAPDIPPFVDLLGEIRVTTPFRVTANGSTSVRSHGVELATAADDVDVVTQFSGDTTRDLDRLGDIIAGVLVRNTDVTEDSPVVDQLRALPQTVSGRLSTFIREESDAFVEIDLDLNLEARDLALKVIDGPSSSTRALLVRVERATDDAARDLSKPETRQRPAGTSAAPAIAADHLLAEIICPQIADGFNLDAAAFEFPCVLRAPTQTRIEAMEDRTDITVERLAARIEGAQIVIDGRISADLSEFASNAPGTATARFTARVDVALVDGQISAEIADIDTSIEIELSPLAELVRRNLVFGNLPDLIRDEIGHLIAKAVRDRANLDSATDEIPQDQLARLEIETFTLDEDALVVAGELAPDTSCAPEVSGRVTLTPGDWFDLDRAKTVLPGNRRQARDADLVWSREDANRDPKPGFRT